MGIPSMPELLLVLFILVVYVCVGIFANKVRGRSFIFWMILSIFITPVLSFLLLILLPKK